VKHRGTSLLILAATLVLCSQNWAATAADVTVKKTPAQVEERTFDPYNPPNPPPPVPPGLRAVTVYDFHCGAYCSADFLDHGTATPEGVKAGVRITSVSIELQTPITIWLPLDAGAKLREHENGHAQISLQGYKDAEQIAEELAKPLVGQTFEATAPTLDEARQAAIMMAAQQFCRGYHARTRDRVREADTYYDDVTNHGKNNVDGKDAMRDAIRKFLK
jgi:hypothetical protein